MLEMLFKKEIYSIQFQKLRDKLKSGKLHFDDYGLNPALTVSWILHNEDFVVSEIIKTLKTRSYQIPIAQEKKVRIDDKERFLYSFDWQEKILQGALAEILNSHFENKFSNSLQSYRKGKGSYNTLLALSDYLKEIKQNEIFILKKDIKAYGDNVDHNLLFNILKKELTENNYILEILIKIINFNYYEWETNLLKSKKTGLPTGSPLNNIMVNLFLSEMDHKIDQYSRTSCYFRYGDDILVATPHEDTSIKIDNILVSTIGEKKLIFNKEKDITSLFEKTANNNDKFRYLGLMIKPTGEMSLTEEKDMEIKDQINKLILKINSMINRFTSRKSEKVAVLIKSLRVLLFKTDLMALLTSYFPIVNDEKYWKNLDLWIAQSLLSQVYDKSGNRVFAKYTFKRLRKAGLPSLRHLRRLFLNDAKRFNKYRRI